MYHHSIAVKFLTRVENRKFIVYYTREKKLAEINFCRRLD
jgi:hypothetical protein